LTNARYPRRHAGTANRRVHPEARGLLADEIYEVEQRA
jgi:hypothetical protein